MHTAAEVQGIGFVHVWIARMEHALLEDAVEHESDRSGGIPGPAERQLVLLLFHPGIVAATGDNGRGKRNGVNSCGIRVVILKAPRKR